jgi:hypothetical protein
MTYGVMFALVLTLELTEDRREPTNSEMYATTSREATKKWKTLGLCLWSSRTEK